ncbi:Eukaryotic translation initiation factor 3 subunit [Dirofilaria immitis]
MSRAARALHWRNQRAVTIIERYWWKFFGGNRFNRSGLNRAKVVTRRIEHKDFECTLHHRVDSRWYVWLRALVDIDSRTVAMEVGNR